VHHSVRRTRTDVQARLNAIHEVVLKNRLEQFKKRQRDDAVKATETASRKEDVPAEAAEEEEEEVEDDWVEEYAPEMSPEPVDVGRMSLDDRRAQVVDEMEHLRAIACHRLAERAEVLELMSSMQLDMRWSTASAQKPCPTCNATRANNTPLGLSRRHQQRTSRRSA
jgi:hypothetical protein